MDTNKEEKPKMFKKRFIFLFAILLIIGMIVADRAQKGFHEYQEQEAITQFEQSMEAADSTLDMLDNAEERLTFLYNQESEDSAEIDSINNVFENRDSLNENEKRRLIKRIRELELRRETHTEEIVMLSAPDTVALTLVESHYFVDVYDTIRIDTVVYDYRYETVVLIDTMIITDKKDIKRIQRILKKHNK